MATFRKLILALVPLLLLAPATLASSSAQAAKTTTWVKKATPQEAAYNAQKIANSPKRCYYRDKSTRFVANAYKRAYAGFSKAEGYRKFLVSKGAFCTVGIPGAGHPVFYTASGGGVAGISAGNGSVWAPDERGCIKRYTLRGVPGTWYHGWGYAKFPPNIPPYFP